MGGVPVEEEVEIWLEAEGRYGCRYVRAQARGSCPDDCVGVWLEGLDFTSLGRQLMGL